MFFWALDKIKKKKSDEKKKGKNKMNNTTPQTKSAPVIVRI